MHTQWRQPIWTSKIMRTHSISISISGIKPWIKLKSRHDLYCIVTLVQLRPTYTCISHTWRVAVEDDKHSSSACRCGRSQQVWVSLLHSDYRGLPISHCCHLQNLLYFNEYKVFWDWVRWWGRWCYDLHLIQIREHLVIIETITRSSANGGSAKQATFCGHLTEGSRPAQDLEDCSDHSSSQCCPWPD